MAIPSPVYLFKHVAVLRASLENVFTTTVFVPVAHVVDLVVISVT